MKGIQIRTAFTMIELIFVIVILGILAAVALPKFLGVKEQAHNSMAIAFAGTMTRTVGHTFWADSMLGGHDGTIRYDSNRTKFEGKSLSYYVDHYPFMLDETTINFDNCIIGNGLANPFMQHKVGYNYNIFCRDGNKTDAPKFVASENDKYTF